MMDTPKDTPNPSDAATQAEAARRSRRAFIGWGLAGLAGLGGWGWLVSRPGEGGIPGPLRRVLEFNEQVSREYFEQTRLAPEFARSRAATPRVNGKYGLEDELDPAAWRLRVGGAGQPQREFMLAEVQALPKVEMVTELKCIEGWSVIVRWAGTRLADFLTHYQLPTTAPYLLLQTPNEKYYVGLDRKSALHPQTLLCYEMNGQPLTPAHGAPLRLVTPLKYGIKYLKRLGSIAFLQERPKDFWAERGYDWDAGH
jgi:DMSO/TMAO reductase YedYZ molybdopterin-dependent catalytic subunit